MERPQHSALLPRLPDADALVHPFENLDQVAFWEQNLSLIPRSSACQSLACVAFSRDVRFPTSPSPLSNLVMKSFLAAFRMTLAVEPKLLRRRCHFFIETPF